MPIKRTLSQLESDELHKLRAELADAQNGASTEEAGEESGSYKSDDKVAGLLHRIQEITGDPASDGSSVEVTR